MVVRYLRDILALDKKLSKEDTITFYRAYIGEDGKEVNLNVDGTFMYLNVRDAVQGMLNEDKEVLKRLFLNINDKGERLMFVIIKISIDIKNSKDIELVPDSDSAYNEQSGSVLVVLNQFSYQIDVEEIMDYKITYKTDDETDIATVTKFSYNSPSDTKEKKKKSKK